MNLRAVHAHAGVDASPDAPHPPVRILVVVQAYFPSVGGAERQVLTLARFLQQNGHHVQIVCPHLDEAFPVGAQSHKGVPVWRIGYPRWPLLGTAVLLCRQVVHLWARRASYDAIHVQIADKMGAVAVIAGRLLGKPVVVKFAGSWERECGALRRHGLMPRLLRLMLRRASAIQATSTRFMQELTELGFPVARLHWLPNAVDVAHFRSLPEGLRRRGPRMPRTLLFVGRLAPDKGLHILLEAWSRTLGRGADGLGRSWRLRLVGEGGQAESLAELARGLDIAGCVEFAGELAAVEDALWAADASVLPSLSEGLSNALLEAMAAGLAVVATRVSGSEDFIRNGENGWLCEPDDVESLAAALRALGATSDEDLRRLGERGRDAVEQRASLPIVTRRLISLYEGGRPVPGGPT